MKREQITIHNYKAIMDKVNPRTLPEVLQNGHKFLIMAKGFYAQEPEIKETIDLYLNHLNNYFRNQKQLRNEASATEIDFIIRFVEMHRTLQSKTAIKSYVHDLQKAIHNKKVVKLSPVAHHISKIQIKLIDLYNDKLLFKTQLKIEINTKWLRELKKVIASNTSKGNTSNLGNLAPRKATPQHSSLFAPINATSNSNTNDTFRLQGDMGTLLGDIERFELAITIEGDQGGGKTRFTYQLADAFATLQDKVAIFSLEIGSRSDLITRMKQEYLSPKNQSRIFISDQLPNGYQTIKEAAAHFDVIIIDSWNKTGLPSMDFDRLRKENPNTVFIVIFQRTTQKTIRGGTAPLFDAGINIEVIKADDSFTNNYAVTTKNRYGVTGIRYNIHSNQIINSAQKTVA